MNSSLLQKITAAAGTTLAALAIAAPAQAQINVSSLDCVTGARVAQVRKAPVSLATVAAKCDRQVRQRVPFARSAFERHAVVAAMVAHRMAPYGATTVTDLSSLLKAKSLNCGNYTYLVYHLMNAAFGQHEASKLRIEGWDFGPFGNHAQMHAGRVMVDPTIAAFADVTWQELYDGKPARSIVYSATHDHDSPWNMSVLAALRDGTYRVVNELSQGQPTTVLYRHGF